MTAIFRSLKFSFILAMHLFDSAAFAKHLVLFKNGQPVPDYDALVSDIQPGDLLEFSNGKTFPVYDVLDGGRGNTTRVVDIGNSKVLRISKQVTLTSLPQHVPGKLFLHGFYDNYLNLVENDVPVPMVYLNESVRDEFIVVQKVNFQITFKQFALNYFKNETNQPLVEALARWFYQSRNAQTIGDFHAGQLIFTGQEWLLIDWYSGFKKNTSTKPYSFAEGGLWNLAKIRYEQRKAFETVMLSIELPKGLEDYLSEAQLQTLEKNLIVTSQANEATWFQQLKNACTRIVSGILRVN